MYRSIAIVVAVIVVSLSMVACGSETTTTTTPTAGDPYEGTWIQESLPESSPATPMIIKKVGDTYAITGSDGEGYSSILHSDPTESGQMTLLGFMFDAGDTAARNGDMLTLTTGESNTTYEITVSGDTMTMVTPGEEGVFTFSRTP